MLDARDLWIAPPGARDPVVRGVSLKLAPGEGIAILGPNGGGKSTLALALAGLIRPQRGTVLWDGSPPGESPADPKSRPVLAVLQDPTSQLLQPTVREELAFTAANLGVAPQVARADAERWAERFGLGGALEEAPHSLSAGNQQLVLLLAALLARPGLLVADEAGAHLDPEARMRVLDAVDEARAAGTAVVWVTQQDEERSRFARALRIGGDEAGPVPPREPAPSRREGEPLLDVDITADAPARGPRVRVSRPARLSIPDRGVAGLTGHNGAGKSVLLGCIAGILSTPQVRLAWREPGGAPPLLVGEHPENMVFEERVRDELAYAAVSRGRARAAVDAEARRMLLDLGLDPGALESRRTWSLSVGEKRAVQLVAGLVAPARLLALDEPTAGLDPSRRRALAELVRQRAELSAVLVATQDREWLDLVGADAHTIGSGPADNAK